ncbi:MAG: hypothetical protein ACI3ZS_05090 [Candidatus Cryptobacteroides sp.]
MDIDLLSKMVKELILDNDKVVLPGLGCFVAEIVPSTFSDKGYTINPPYRRLYFRSKPDEGNLLIDFYASSNKLEHSVAEHIITDFISGLKSVLHTRKMVMFPGLGRLRATRENNLFFVADENLEIYPSGFGLEPVSLKNHEETREEVAAAVEGLASMLPARPAPVEAAPEPSPVVPEPAHAVPELVPGPATDFPAPVAPTPEPVIQEEDAIDLEVDDSASVLPEPVPEPEINVGVEVIPEPIPEPEPLPEQETIPEPEVEPVPEIFPAKNSIDATDVDHGARKPEWKKIIKAAGIAIAAVAILLAVFVLTAHLAPDFVDRLLYNEEELEILHYRF